MATLILDYDARNVQAQKAVEFILSLNIFRIQKSSAAKAETLSEKRKKVDKIFDNYLIDLSEFKFDRDEANNYD